MNNSRSGNIRGFLTIFAGQSVSLLGSSLVRFSLIWWLTLETNSPQVLATASLMAYLPDLIVGPFSGVLVDRMDRKKLMILSDAFVAIVTGVMAILYVRGIFGLNIVYGLLLVRSLGTSFHWPAMESSIALMVPEDQLQRVSGLQQGVNGLVNVVGPPVGALLISIFPLEYVFAIDVLTALLAIIPLIFTYIPQPETDGSRITVSSIISDMREGFSFLIKWRSLLSFALMIMLVHIVVIPAISFMPLLVSNFFNGDARAFAVMESFFGAGIIAGGIILSSWGGFQKKTYTIISSLILCGLGFLILWRTPNTMIQVGYVGTFIFASSVSIVSASIGALQKSLVPTRIQGRVFTLIRSGTNAMPALGLALAGPVTEIIGLKTWYLVGGVIFILIGVATWMIQDLKNIEDNRNDMKNG